MEEELKAEGEVGYPSPEGEAEEEPYHEPSEAQVDGVNALNLQWVMGFNKDLFQGTHNLTTDERTEIFYSAAHTGVIYDYEKRTQKLLQGHCNQITCTACSEDKSLIVTADSGQDSMLVVWDSLYATPQRTYFNPHENGVIAMDISADARYLVTLSNNLPQTISLWDLSNDELTEPIVSSTFNEKADNFQRQVRFNSSNYEEIMTTGDKAVLFFSWSEGNDRFSYYEPVIMKQSFSDPDSKRQSKLNQSVFLPASTQAVTSTDQGDILVWDLSMIVDGMAQPDERRLIKVVTLQKGASINILTIHGNYLVTGDKNGHVKFYDFYFKIVAWFEHLDMSRIMSISFAYLEPEDAQEPDVYEDEE